MRLANLRRGRAAMAAGAAALLAVAGCSSDADSSSGAGGDAKVTIQTAPGNVLPYLGYLAKNLGYFKQNKIDARFATLTTGLSSTAALNAGSLNVIFADPASTGPLMAKGAKIRMILAEQTIQWRLLVPPAQAGMPLDQLMRSLKTVGAPAAAGGTASLLKLMEHAYGIPVGTIKPVADQSGAGVVAKSEQAIIVEPAASCVLEEKQGLKEAFSFAKPLHGPYPPDLQQAIGIPDIGYWTLSSWADQHPAVVKGLQAALTKAEAWANDPKNLDQWVKIMRSSPLNNKALDDAQYKRCLSSVQGAFEPHFSAADAQRWSGIVKLEGLLPGGLPDSSTWLDKNVPAS